MTDKKKDLGSKKNDGNIIDISKARAQKDIEDRQKQIWGNISSKDTPKAQKEPFFKKRGGHHEKMINLPPLTKAMLALFLGIHIVCTFFVSDTTLYKIYQLFGFVAAHYTYDGPIEQVTLMREIPIWSKIISPFTYSLLHGNWSHIAMNGLMLAAFGSGLERACGAKRLLAFFCITTILSLILQFALAPNSIGVVIGASGGLSAYFGAILKLFYQRGLLGYSKYGLWPIIIIWVIISVVFGMLGSPDGTDVAWAAHLGGFFAGIILAKPLLKIQ